MKKIMSIILFFLLWVTYTQADLSKYEESVKSDTNFSEFWLLENYLKNHKNKLLIFQEKYEISNNQKLIYYIKEIEKLEKLANNIYKNKSVTHDRKVVSEEIVKKIKTINTQLKEILIYEKFKFEQNLTKKHTAYSFIAKEIGNNIYLRINQQIEVIKQSNLSKENKLKIVIHLRNLEKNALYLKNFENITFDNEKEMKKSFTQIFETIKQDLRAINELLQK